MKKKKKISREENLIHVKIDYGEAVQSKRDILSIEKDFLHVLKLLKRYHLLRKEELLMKIKLQNKMKSLKDNLRKLNDVMPKVKSPAILKRDIVEGATKEKKEEYGLEAQLREIQAKLRNLG